MSKIITALNVMISNDYLISNVLQGYNSNEIFFMYNKKHKWSVTKKQNDIYIVHYYPGSTKLEDLASWPDEAWADFPDIVSYGEEQLSTKEAQNTLKELYTILGEKIFGMDDVLDEIIESDDNIPF